MKKSLLAKILIFIFVITIFAGILYGCRRQADVVSHNLSVEADNFNVTRKLTVINTRAEDPNLSVLFQAIGNFSVDKEADGDLAIIGENDDGTYYKHFVYLTRDVTYIVEDIGKNSVSKYKFEVYFNPYMVMPITSIDIVTD